MVKLYQVGGAVRDQFMGLASHDIDYAVEAGSYQEMLDWVRARGKVFLERPEYGTIRAKLRDDQAADFVLCRRDGYYSDGRHPDEVVVGTIMDDLARRDFTMNAIAVEDSTLRVIDPFEGRAHIEARILHCVGDARTRFYEDALRMLRAVRFSVTRGMRLDDDIMRSFADPELLARLVDNVSQERKREELEKCFKHDSLETFRLLTLINIRSNFVLMRHLTDLFWFRPLVRQA